MKTSSSSTNSTNLTIADDRADVRASAAIQAPSRTVGRTWPSLEDILSEKGSKKSPKLIEPTFTSILERAFLFRKKLKNFQIIQSVTVELPAAIVVNVRSQCCTNSSEDMHGSDHEEMEK